jgi:hypothetical protein
MTKINFFGLFEFQRRPQSRSSQNCANKHLRVEVFPTSPNLWRFAPWNCSYKMTDDDEKLQHTWLYRLTQKSMSQILRLWCVEAMKIVILHRSMSFCFDSTTLIIDFTSLVHFIWKIIFWPARDSNQRPLRTLFNIKTPNRNLAFSAMPLLEN